MTPEKKKLRFSLYAMDLIFAVAGKQNTLFYEVEEA